MLGLLVGQRQSARRVMLVQFGEECLIGNVDIIMTCCKMAHRTHGCNFGCIKFALARRKAKPVSDLDVINIWFGTRGSEVQILSPRPYFPKLNQAVSKVGRLSLSVESLTFCSCNPARNLREQARRTAFSARASWRRHFSCLSRYSRSTAGSY